MERERPSVEILVHITAPSRAIDDVKYRSLASAYNDFQSATRIPLLLSQAHHVDLVAGQKATTRQSRDASNTQAAGFVGSSSGSLQASFSSVLDNANSTEVCPPKLQSQTPIRDSQQTTHPSVWSTPPSIVQDSLAEDPTHLAAFTSPTRLLEHYLQGFGSSPTKSPSSVHTGIASQWSAGATGRGQALHFPEEKAGDPSSYPNCSSTPPFPTALSVIPCTPSENQDGGHPLAEAIANHRKEEPHKSPVGDYGDIVEETALVSSGEYPPCLARADSEPPPSKRRQPDMAAVSPRPLLRTASDTGATSSSTVSHSAALQKLPVAIAFLPSHCYTYESLELHSPDPPTSSIQIPFGGKGNEEHHFITAGLAKLAADLDITRRFRPQASTRALSSTERGYWHIDCRAWDDALRRDAWAFLANYVGTGVAGWGVWCRRDDGFMSIRAYCWGAIAPHIYLLLYLASQRRILFTGADWVDGGGESVITMGARSVV